MRKLKDWLKAYMEYTSYTEAPEQFHFWTGVSVISSALRRKVWLDMLYWEWSPNFYIIFVAPPGIATKSTTMGIGKNLLSELNTIHFGPAAITWQTLLPILNDATESVPMPDGSFYPMSCVSFFLSELGTFLDLQDRKMLDVLVDMWDGHKGTWQKGTVSRGIESVVNPWITIVAGVTPNWLSDNLPRVLIGGGFASRCIFVFGNEKRNYIPFPKRVVQPAWVKNLKADLVNDLAIIASLRGEFTLTEEAYECAGDWYVKYWKEATSMLMVDSDMTGYIARKQAHVLKLAMIISASQQSDLIITKDHFLTAVTILESIEKGLPAIFRKISTDVGQEMAEKVLLVVKEKGKIEKTRLYQIFFHSMSAAQFNEVIASALTAGYIRQLQQSTRLIIEWVGTGQP
jgi:hypothetical protein